MTAPPLPPKLIPILTYVSLPDNLFLFIKLYYISLFSTAWVCTPYCAFAHGALKINNNNNNNNNNINVSLFQYSRPNTCIISRSIKYSPCPEWHRCLQLLPNLILLKTKRTIPHKVTHMHKYMLTCTCAHTHIYTTHTQAHTHTQTCAEIMQPMWNHLCCCRAPP